jgi:hypothetical protein
MPGHRGDYRHGVTWLHQHGDAPVGQISLGFGQSFQHEAVVAPIGVRIAGGECKNNHHRQV